MDDRDCQRDAPSRDLHDLISRACAATAYLVGVAAEVRADARAAQVGAQGTRAGSQLARQAARALRAHEAQGAP